MSDSEFLSQCTRSEHTFDGVTHPIFVAGSGPPLILLHELDGFNVPFIKLAERFSREFTVYAPLLYGRVGRPEAKSKVGQIIDGFRGYWCMRRELSFLSTGRTGVIAGWTRHLAERVSRESDGRSVGIVGMCMTGGLVLATISHPAIGAGVSAQPSLPLAMSVLGTMRRRQDFGLSPDEVGAINQTQTPLLTLRFSGDKICPGERISQMEKQIPHMQGPPDFLNGVCDHPTLTACFRHQPKKGAAEASEKAIAATITFLTEHLDHAKDEPRR